MTFSVLAMLLAVFLAVRFAMHSARALLTRATMGFSVLPAMHAALVLHGSLHALTRLARFCIRNGCTDCQNHGQQRSGQWVTGFFEGMSHRNSPCRG
jgi:hypothetical protein